MEKGTKANKIKFPSYIMPLMLWLIIFGYIAFLAAIRTGMNDTSAYVASFKDASGTIQSSLEFLLGDGKDKGFYFFTEVFKLLISDNYHMWFAFFQLLNLCVLYIYILRKESISILDSCFFFFTSALYYNYFSMMRQWFAVALLFLAFKWLKQKQFIPYLLFCLLAAQFHNSAYLCIPIFFWYTINPLETNN